MNQTEAQFDSKPEKPSFTQAQVDNINRLLKLKDPYVILGLNPLFSNSYTDSDLRSAYHQLALQYHTDRNKAPNANKAFIHLSNAYRKLVEKKQSKNDLSKDSKTWMNDLNTGSESDILTPEEIYDLFSDDINMNTPFNDFNNNTNTQSRIIIDLATIFIIIILGIIIHN